MAETALVLIPGAGKLRPVTKVQAIENAIKQLNPDEVRQVRAWLDDFLEDQLEFTDEFRAKVERSRQAMLAGERPRVSQP